MANIVFVSIEGEKVRTVSQDFQNKYLKIVDGKSSDKLNPEQKKKVFLRLFDDFLDEEICLDEFSLFAALLTEFTAEEEGLEYDLFHTTLQAASLNNYVRHIPDSRDAIDNFIAAMRSVKEFVEKYKNTLE